MKDGVKSVLVVQSSDVVCRLSEYHFFGGGGVRPHCIRSLAAGGGIVVCRSFRDIYRTI